MKKNRRRIIITVLEILAVLLLLGPVYRLACGIGLKKVKESDYWSTRYDEDQLDDEIRQALKKSDSLESLFFLVMSGLL